MKKLSFVRGVATAGHILFSILRVMMVIAAVFVLLGILSLSMLPKNTVTVDTYTQMVMKFDLRTFIGEETWDEVKEELIDSIVEGGKISEDGSVVIEESEPSETLENRTMSLVLVPVFAELLVSFFFYHFMARLFKLIRNAVSTPFLAGTAKELKNAGISLFAMAAVPAAVSTLLALFTGVTFTDSSVDLGTVLWGFVLLALSMIFEFGATLTPAPSFPASDGFGPYSGAATPFDPPRSATPDQQKPEDQNDSSFHPNAF